MTIEDVKEEIEEIKKLAGDPEAAHSREDILYYDVLSAIAEGDPNTIELAKLALTTTKIEFSRWCA